jgi:hypothetical protein
MKLKEEALSLKIKTKCDQSFLRTNTKISLKKKQTNYLRAKNLAVYKSHTLHTLIQAFHLAQIQVLDQVFRSLKKTCLMIFMATESFWI